MTTICIKSISTTVKIGPNHYYYSLVVTTVIKSYSNTSDCEVEFRTYLLQNRKTGQLSVFSTFSTIIARKNITQGFKKFEKSYWYIQNFIRFQNGFRLATLANEVR